MTACIIPTIGSGASHVSHTASLADVVLTTITHALLGDLVFLQVNLDAAKEFEGKHANIVAALRNGVGWTAGVDALVLATGLTR